MVQIKLLFLLMILGCNSNKYCYDYESCLRKYKLGFAVTSHKDSSSLLELEIYNDKNSSILMKDSIVVFFYKFNQNLRNPTRDSISDNNNKIITYVEQASPVHVFTIMLQNQLLIAPKSRYVFPLRKEVLEKVVKSLGNPDNTFQLKHSFQLFMCSTLSKNNQLHLASNIFNL